MSDLKLSKRLSAAASFVRDGAVCADIGTDHAYIPISLVLDGRVKYAIASDINEGPILKARENIEKYGLSDKITARIADGLNSIEEYKPNSIVICGMGGELIARIINDCAYVKQQGIQLILQPMTSIAELREYLSHGFKIYDEDIVFDADKLYQIICAEYDGNEHSYTSAELEIGKINIEKRPPLYENLVNSFIDKKKKRYNGLKLGGHPTVDVENEIKELEKLL